MDEFQLMQLEQSLYNDLEEAVDESREAGIELAQCENDYQKLKAQCMAQMRADGVPVTAAKEMLGGDPEVAAARLARDMADVRTSAAHDLINVLKLKYRFVTEQIQREWTRPSNK